MSSLIRGSFSSNKTANVKHNRTVRPKRNNLKFGVDPSKLCVDDDLHPGLHELLRHIYLNGPTGPTFPVLRRASRSQSKILKKCLQQGQLRRISKYPPNACLLCFRNFLKHSPKSPLLQGEEFLRLADDINMLPPSQRSWLVCHCRRMLSCLRPVDSLLLKYLIGIMRSLCFLNGDTLYQNKLDELISLFGPVILRQKQSSFTKFSKLFFYQHVCPEAVVITRFLIIHATEVFGPQIDQLYESQGNIEMPKSSQECVVDEEIIIPLKSEESVQAGSSHNFNNYDLSTPDLLEELEIAATELSSSSDEISQELETELITVPATVTEPEPELEAEPEPVLAPESEATAVENEVVSKGEIQEKEETDSSISQKSEEQTGLVKFDPNLIDHITEINRTVSNCQNLSGSDENTEVS